MGHNRAFSVGQVLFALIASALTAGIAFDGNATWWRSAITGCALLVLAISAKEAADRMQ